MIRSRVPIERKARLACLCLCVVASVGCGATRTRVHATAFAISCEASGAQVHDPGGNVIGACPVHGSILWKETIRHGAVTGQTTRELRAQEGQTRLVQLDRAGAVIRVYLAGTVEAPGCKPQAFREYVGYCSSETTRLEKQVDVKVDLANGR